MLTHIEQNPDIQAAAKATKTVIICGGCQGHTISAMIVKKINDTTDNEPSLALVEPPKLINVNYLTSFDFGDNMCEEPNYIQRKPFKKTMTHAAKKAQSKKIKRQKAK